MFVIPILLLLFIGVIRHGHWTWPDICTGRSTTRGLLLWINTVMWTNAMRLSHKLLDDRKRTDDGKSLVNRFNDVINFIHFFPFRLVLPISLALSHGAWPLSIVIIFDVFLLCLNDKFHNRRTSSTTTNECVPKVIAYRAYHQSLWMECTII